MSEWQLQDAKARLSEVVKRAVEEGPQTVTVRGERTVVVLSTAEYDRLTQPQTTLLEVLTSGPKIPEDILQVMEYRDKSPPRDIEF